MALVGDARLLVLARCEKQLPGQFFARRIIGDETKYYVCGSANDGEWVLPNGERRDARAINMGSGVSEGRGAKNVGESLE